MTRDEVKTLIAQRALAAGMDPQHALAVASIESSFDPNAGRGSSNPHKGLFQFGPSEWDTYGGGGDIYDPSANVNAFINYQNDINNRMTQALGRAPTPQEQYLGWQQGAGGAIKLLSNPTASAADLVGGGAITSNAGKLMQTASGFTNQWADKYNQAVSGLGGVPQVQPELPTTTLPTEPTPPTSGLLAKDEDKDYNKAILSAAKQTSELGKSLLASSYTPAASFSPAPSVPMPQAQPVPLPNFPELLAQQRLRRRF